MDDYREGYNLVAAIVERARMDLEYGEGECPYSISHTVDECAADLIDALERFTIDYPTADAVEYALEFFDLVGEVSGS